METAVRIVAAERVTNGVLIEFSDGQVALFPTSLLWELVPGFNVESLRDSAEDIAPTTPLPLKNDEGTAE